MRDTQTDREKEKQNRNNDKVRQEEISCVSAECGVLDERGKDTISTTITCRDTYTEKNSQTNKVHRQRRSKKGKGTRKYKRKKNKHVYFERVRRRK